MKLIKSLTYSDLVRSQLQVKETMAILIASVALPFLIHFIPPFTNAPVGAVLLPMFYAPLIAVLLFRYHVAVIAGISAPVLNALLLGAPAWSLTTVLTVEIVAFVTLVYILNQKTRLSWFSAPISLVSAKLISTFILIMAPALLAVTPMNYLVASLSNGALGIAIITVISYLAFRIKK